MHSTGLMGLRGGSVRRAFAFSALGLTLACAELVEEPPPTPSNRVRLACSSNSTDTTSFFDWELDVDAEPIQPGQLFTVNLGGAIVVPLLNIGVAQILVPGGFREVNVIEGRATVHVRAGAIGVDRVLEVSAVPYQCLQSRNECSPDHDLEGLPGFRPNSDCQPVNTSNPCSRIIPIQTNDDCEPGGLCDSLGGREQCDLNGFCATNGVRVPLEEVTAQYIATPDAKEVLFGWDDQNTSATLEEGCWHLPELNLNRLGSYLEPGGPNSFRVTARGAPLAVECTMGVGSETCPSGQSSQGASRAPDSRLIALPVR